MFYPCSNCSMVDSQWKVYLYQSSDRSRCSGQLSLNSNPRQVCQSVISFELWKQLKKCKCLSDETNAFLTFFTCYLLIVYTNCLMAGALIRPVWDISWLCRASVGYTLLVTTVKRSIMVTIAIYRWNSFIFTNKLNQ